MVELKLLKPIFLQALEFSEFAERIQFLDRVCSHDSDLRREADRLLRAYESDDDLLEPTTRVEAKAIAETVRHRISDSVSPMASPGKLIGERYQLLELLGEGGMGSVWKAQQVSPVTRWVALKLVKQGMDSQLILDRFHRERQALAMLDHAHIARVLDGATTDHGQPYFVMEMVEGVPINQYCERHQLDLRDRLE